MLNQDTYTNKIKHSPKEICGIMLSVHPNWMKKIVRGEKTMDVRKNVPVHAELPFKVYLYCTKKNARDKAEILTIKPKKGEKYHGNGKVIGECTCTEITCYEHTYEIPDEIYEKLCLERKIVQAYIMVYGGNAYCWNLTDLVIYDKPKELEQFGIQKAPQNWNYVYTE